ncbi:hypothetical protein QCA50_002535 [Cerrena zonata]|uniref:RRM domain-containing protein n=1 Tax=Cerrena zonata TaxID=2478898 RepID=A0AAW0GVR2_9APHY
MSPKQPTSLREWGTRYDTLGSSSPSAPGSPTRSPPLPPSSSHTQNNITSVTPPTSANKQHFEGTTPISMRPDKMPQDASIFVGSLPSNMDPGELGRALKDHLSDHLEAKSVKVVRDAKNRVCAFIQCEDAASAARLMETLQARPPGMFYGRHLRFEPARGFRTLLISYRIPTEWQTTDASDPREGHTIERPLNIAIRLYRPPGHRYITVLYDDKAEGFVPSAPRNTHDDPTGIKEDVFGGEGVLFAPLSYDAEMIRQMAELFGPLEHFTPFTSDSVGPSERIYPHNSPRSLRWRTAFGR